MVFRQQEPRQAEILFVLLSFAKQVACDFQNTDFAEVVIELARMYSPTSPVVYQVVNIVLDIRFLLVKVEPEE